MRMNRRTALACLAGLVATSTVSRRSRAAASSDPLAGNITAYVEGLEAGDWTAAGITAIALERCRDDGAAWRAIDLLDPDTALADARAADARRREGRRLGPLDGVPVLAKSIYDMRGLPTTASSAEWARLYPDPVARDALEVSRLRAGGAIVLGKTAADDFAYRGNGTSSHTGQVLNPYDRTGTRTPGGSSAGSAVAVAGAMAFAALGTDDGGSNRIPAQFTGVVGMKPTFGLVPRTGVIPTWPYLDTHGPLARSVADAARLLAVIAGADSSDPYALEDAWDSDALVGLRDDALDGVRLGIVEEHVPRAAMTGEALAVWDRAVEDLRGAGAAVEAFSPAVTRYTVEEAFGAAAVERGDVVPDPKAAGPTANALYAYFVGRRIRGHGPLLQGDDSREMMRRGSGDDPREVMRRGYAAYRAFYDVLPASFEECEALIGEPSVADPAGESFARSRASVVAALAASMRSRNVRAMVYPTMPFNAPRAVDDWPDIRTPLGYGNWLGLPEVSVPAGYGADGMPALNLSIVGLPGEDASVLAWAHAFERQGQRFRAPPGVATSP